MRLQGRAQRTCLGTFTHLLMYTNLFTGDIESLRDLPLTSLNLRATWLTGGEWVWVRLGQVYM